MNRKAFCSWSGGKDSCLALNRAIKNGYEITHLLTMFDETGERSRSHAVSIEVMQAQAESLGLKLIAPVASWQDYEKVFIEELRKLKSQNVEAAIFGDIDLQAHRDWEERVCAAAEIEAVLPFVERKPSRFSQRISGERFSLGRHLHKRKISAERILRARFRRAIRQGFTEGVDACGENGEFHTFVFDGELFKNPVPYKIDEIYRHAPVYSSGEAANFYYAKLVL
jgi:uncharacterized protein (TIGR00290 family)